MAYGLLTFGASVGGAFAEEDISAIALLDAMRSAMREQTYRGLVAYSRDNEVENMEIVHAVADGVEREKLVSLNGPVREVIRHGRVVRCYLPERKTVVVDAKPSGKSSFVDVPEDFSQLRGYYDFSLGRRDRVAQRDAQEINVMPRDDLRYARRIWIDLASKLPVKVELLDEDRRVVEQMVFSSLEISGAVPATDLEPSSIPDQPILQETRRENLPIDSLHWTLQSVPNGFRIVSFTRMTPAPQGRTIDHLLLSDGFSSISVYFDRVENQPVVNQPSQMGAINTYSRKIGDFLVTTMGEAPAKTIQTIGNGIRFQE